ncbi:MAG TPA: oligopeptide/dipeptide ABC transporter ATP-binding protein, partial [Xanthobacteraceae bacterium]|nr:oligopeptide/dipeptide ABC transporter ATP-binding protein [Xanthobacteraceae bacterium]
LAAVPRLTRTGAPARARLAEIEGALPALDRAIVGCRFAPRCRIATERCRRDDPPLETKCEGHVSACWHADRAAAAVAG